MHPGGRVSEIAGAPRQSRVAKRGLDLVLASIVLLLALPVIAVSALAILIVDGRPMFFSQQREGLDGRSFRLLKLRTMRRDAEARLAEVLASDSKLSEEWDRYLCLRNDPRVLPYVGRFLRRTSIDELPQLINVLRGEMSLVGPRPPLASEVETYAHDVRRRLLVKPGMTGLWQINGRSDLSWDESVRFDLYYVENWSVMSDLIILWRTGRAVLRSSGAY